MNYNGKANAQQTYDAIVVGSGISGGWAAKELTEKGLKVLLIERGRKVEHIKDYTTAMNTPWDNKHRTRLTPEEKEQYTIQSRCYAFNDETKQWWVNDRENPYTEVQPFNWLRGYHLGGRSLMWGRQSYRWSDLDFGANARDGHGTDWPIRYKDIEPWYDYVETFAGISGNRDGLAQLPDGKFLPPMDMNCLEEHARDKVNARWKDRHIIIGRTANLSKAAAPQLDVKRQSCQFRNRCHWGCPFGGYFSTLSATLPAAMATGNLTLRTDAIALEVLYDEARQRASGVRILDTHTKKTEDYTAKIVFVNASTLGTTWLLMHSVSNRFPNGLGNDSGVLGHYLMDHHFSVGAGGRFDGFGDKYYYGRRANGVYVPRYRNLHGDEKRGYVRGFGYQGGASRGSWGRGAASAGIGVEFKKELAEPGEWGMGLGSWGECLPYHENGATLDKSKTDAYGLPTLKINCSFKENELAMRKDMMNDAAEMLDAAGLKDIHTYDGLKDSPPGHCIHEMGTARMGRDPKTSMLNAWNQLHAVKNVFITDGSCMASTACQNPSLTYMALTARAADYAVKELKKGNI
ncbi:GMC family oxidoreductase [Compostibacter hankyongensis]|uniref:GMC family oxidoreductase n=1 Tax=Compostibacter hankyongensis TaxID=1007089 RepID=A0ABP8G0Q1_9BACT